MPAKKFIRNLLLGTTLFLPYRRAQTQGIPSPEVLQEFGIPMQDHHRLEQGPFDVALSTPEAAPANSLGRQADRRIGAAAADLNFDGGKRWEPLGMLPVDQAQGGGSRGYGIPGEGAQVTKAGSSQYFLHETASNYLYEEATNNFLIKQRFESHTTALGFRHGFNAGHLPRFELGAQIQAQESDAGFMNGLMKSFDNLIVDLTGNHGASDPLRDGRQPHPPLGYTVQKDGKAVYQAQGRGWGWGDVSLVAKAALKDGAPSSKAALIATRITLNLAGQSRFSGGNYIGSGISLNKKISELISLYGDFRGTLALDRTGKLGLPLKRGSIGSSGGVEFHVARNSSFNLQFDADSSPYQHTDTNALDRGYSAISLGFGHRFDAGDRQIVAQFYGRENAFFPTNIHNNLDPDFAIGLKITIDKR